MFFSTTIAVQYWIDAYNIQPATLLWGWMFWVQKLLEQFTYSLPYASLLIFVLALLYPDGLLKRYPIALPSIILFSGSIIKWTAMTTAPTLGAAFKLGNWVSVIPAMTQMALALGIAIYFLFTSHNKIALAQLRIILAGAILPILITFVYSISLVLTGTSIISRDFGISLVLLMPISFAVAILRYQFFDIEVIINQGLVYGSLTLLLGSFYIILVITLTFLLQTVTLGFNQDMVVFIATLSIALIFNPLKQRVQVLIDRTFFRSKVDYRHLLSDISAQLSKNIVLEQLTQLLTEEIPRQLKISGASLQVFDADERDQTPPLAQLAEQRSEIARTLAQFEKAKKNQTQLNIPLVVGRADSLGRESTERLVGQYNLGPKLSQKPYSSEEINLLITLGKQAAVAVENTRLYREIERYNHTLKQKIQERTQQLADAKNTAENANTLLETVLNNLDTLVYVGDLQTGEILFANQPMQKIYGPVQGKICWQVLYSNKSASCNDCTNHLLVDENGEPTGVQHREVQDKDTGHWYSNISSAIRWTDGRFVRLATRLDITETKEAESLLRTHEHELAKEEERRQLARDLHDTLTQSLHSLVLTADTSQRLLKNERFDVLPDSIQLLADSARQSLREMRLLLHELQLSPDEEIDLKEMLNTRLAIVEQRIGIKTSLEINGQKYLSKTFRREIFYIVMEALNNSIKHAHPDQIWISVQASPTQVELLVKDNGRGFDTKPLVDKGMGFNNMRFRVEKLKGTLQITSSPRGGTAVRLNVDL